MAGLVVVAGREGAEALARRAAAPLLRQAWQELSVASSPDGRVAVGFAGERGGVAADPETGILAALDGELFGVEGVRTGTAGAAAILTLYRRSGAGFDPPDGCFSASVWDPAGRSLVLVADRLASRPLYVWQPDGAIVAAGELKTLVAAGLVAALDLEGAAEVLAYRHLLGERTLLAGVRALTGGTTLVLGPGGAREHRRWRFALEPEEGDDGELVEEFGRLLERAVERRLDGTEVLTLSGGLDSRCLAAVLATRGFGGPAATWTWPGSRDRDTAAAVARAAGIRHRLLELEPGFASQRAPRCIWLGELRKSSLRSQELSLEPLRVADGVRAALVGSHGDHVTRMKRAPRTGPGEAELAAAVHAERAEMLSDEMLEQLLTPAFARELRGVAASRLAAALAQEKGCRDARYAALRFRRVSSTALFDDHIAPRDPFVDRDLVDFCARLPWRLRLHGEIERAFVRLQPRLARLPVPEDGGPPAALRSAGTRRVAVAAGRGARRRLPPRLRGTRASGRRFAHALGAGDDRRSVARILLEPRTLARGQVREDGVTALLGAAGRGDLRHVGAIAALVGLELFQRQFLDGGGDPGPVEGA